MTSCPDCCCPGTVIASRLCSNGSRRRRYECLGCFRRWTHHEGDPPHRNGAAKGLRGAKRQISDSAIRRILEATGSIRQISLATGWSRPMVTAIRRGELYPDIWPDLPRRPAPAGGVASLSCHHCDHWSRRCGLGFPDPDEEGPGFANDCSSYLPTLKS